jgi:hypothetical protein
LLPVPYGLVAHELIEVIDNERIMPGITWISKMAEDFPQVDCHSLNKEADKKFTNIHQLVFLFCNPKSPSYTIFKALPIARFEEGDLVPFSTYNNIRYTFIKNLFKSYDLYD